MRARRFSRVLRNRLGASASGADEPAMSSAASRSTATEVQELQRHNIHETYTERYRHEKASSAAEGDTLHGLHGRRPRGQLRLLERLSQAEVGVRGRERRGREELWAEVGELERVVFWRRLFHCVASGAAADTGLRACAASSYPFECLCVRVIIVPVAVTPTSAARTYGGPGGAPGWPCSGRSAAAVCLDRCPRK